jgi:hypothetical protein
MTLRSVAAAYVMTQPRKNAVQMQILIIFVILMKPAVKGFAATLIASSVAMANATKTGNAASMATVSKQSAMNATRSALLFSNVIMNQTM